MASRQSELGRYIEAEVRKSPPYPTARCRSIRLHFAHFDLESEKLLVSTDPFIQSRDWLGALPVQQETHADGWFARGMAHVAAGNFGEAADCFRRVLEIHREHPSAWINLGAMHAEFGDQEQALHCYNQCLAINPDHPEALYNLGNSLRILKQWARAETVYRHAIAVLPSFGSAWTNLAVAIMDQGRLAEAEATFRTALSIVPASAEAANGLGLALMLMGRYTESAEYLERALALAPQLPPAHYNRGLLALLCQDYARGWREYEWRWSLPDSPPRRFSMPKWNGEPLEGKRIVLHAEQGIGDSIQFLRFIPLVKLQAGEVVFECPQKMMALFGACPGVDRMIARESGTVPESDYHCPLMSLGQFFVHDESDIPACHGLLSPGSEREAFWRKQLQSISGFRVGIAWRGSPGYRWDCLRSLPLGKFAPLAEIESVSLISLQKGAGAEEVGFVDFSVHDLGERVDRDGNAMLDTAAIVRNLDLVICADTSLGHLAATLGVPTWILLPLSPDWRWGVSGDRSPWYPSVRLLRQTRQGDWDSLMSEVADELAHSKNR